MVERFIEDARLFELQGLSKMARRTLLFAQELRSEGFPEKLPSVSVWETDEATGEKFYRHDKFLFFPEKHLVVRKDGRKVNLGLMHSGVLVVFVDNVNRIVKNKELVRKVWGENYLYDKYAQQSLRSLIKELREKIEPDRKKPKIIITSLDAGHYLWDEKRTGFLRKLEPEKVISFPNFTYYPELRIVEANGNRSKLGRIENKVLRLMAENPNRTITRSVFYEKIFPEWQGDLVDDNRLKMHIIHIRNKLEPGDRGMRNYRGQKSCIRTVRGVGYELVNSNAK